MEQLELDKFEGIVSLPLLLHRSNKWVAEQPAGQRFLRTPDSVESSPSGPEIGDQLCSSDHWVPNRAPPSRAPPDRAYRICNYFGILVGMVAMTTPKPKAKPRKVPAGKGAVPSRSVVKRPDSLREVVEVSLDDVADRSLAPKTIELIETMVRDVIEHDRGAEADEWERLVGAVLTPKVTCELLGISRQALDKRRKGAKVLAVPTVANRWVYPLAQFDVDGSGLVVNPTVEHLAPSLVEANSHSGAVRWLATPNRQLEGRAPWDAIDDGDSDAVIAAAQRQIAAWSGR